MVKRAVGMLQLFVHVLICPLSLLCNTLTAQIKIILIRFLYERDRIREAEDPPSNKSQLYKHNLLLYIPRDSLTNISRQRGKSSKQSTPPPINLLLVHSSTNTNVPGHNPTISPTAGHPVDPCLPIVKPRKCNPPPHHDLDLDPEPALRIRQQQGTGSSPTGQIPASIPPSAQSRANAQWQDRRQRASQLPGTQAVRERARGAEA